MQPFQTHSGRFTLSNIHGLTDSATLSAVEATIKVSLITAVLGGLLGLLVAQAALREEAGAWIRPVMTTFAGVAANFAGRMRFHVPQVDVAGTAGQHDHDDRLGPTTPRPGASLGPQTQQVR